MLIGVGQQGQEACALDRRGELALIERLRARDAAGDNLAGLMRAVEYLRRFECVAKARRPFAFRAQRYAPVGK